MTKKEKELNRRLDEINSKLSVLMGGMEMAQGILINARDMWRRSRLAHTRLDCDGLVSVSTAKRFLEGVAYAADHGQTEYFFNVYEFEGVEKVKEYVEGLGYKAWLKYNEYNGRPDTVAVNFAFWGEDV